MQAYRLREAMVAVSRDGGGMRIITLPVNAVLMVEKNTLLSGLVDTLWDGQTVSVFVQDLRARAELVDRATGA